MKNDGEVGETFGNLFQNIEPKHRFLARFEFECAVAGSDGDSQRVNACTVNKFFYFIGMCIFCIFCRYVYIIFHACQLSQFAFNHNAFGMSIFNDSSCQFNILIKGMMGTVDHNGSKSAVDTGFADIEICAVIQMKSDRNIVLNQSCFNQFYKIRMICIFSGSCRNLKDQRGIQFAGGFCDTLYDLHVVYIESADCVSAVISFLKHFCCCN